ncbi:MAG: autotransporter domain-containing protein [Pseudomonadota bacterium]
MSNFGLRFTAKRLAIAVSMLGSVSADAALVNGGFEDGLTGWTTTVNGGAHAVSLATGSAAGSINASPSGDQYIYTSQSGAGSSFITQEFTVGGSVNKVFFDIAINNSAGAFSTPDSLDYTDSPNQQARFDILKVGSSLTSLDPADIIATVYQTQVGDPNSQDWQTVAVDVSSELSAYVGQDVIFRFSQVDTQGVFNLALDNINVGEAQFVQLLSALESASTMRNSSAYGAARIIDRNQELLALFTAANLSTDQEVSDGVSQTLPLLTGGGYMAARTALYGINSAVKTRQNVVLGRSAGTGLNSGDGMLKDQHFWIKPFGTRTEQDDRGGVSGYDADTGGLILGLDSSLNDRTRLGVAFAYANTRVEGNSDVAPHDLDVDSYQLIGYGSRSLDDTTDLTFQVDLGQNRNDGKRTIALNNSTADADYDSYTGHLGLGLTRSYTLSESNRVSAGIKTDYTWIKDESYNETGADVLNLDVDSNTTEALVAGLEGQLSHSVNQAVELNANLGLGYDVLNEQASITSAYAAAPGAQFTTEGIDPNPWIATGGVGLLHIANNGAELSANYDVEYRSDYLSQSVSLKLRWAF